MGNGAKIRQTRTTKTGLTQLRQDQAPPPPKAEQAIPQYRMGFKKPAHGLGINPPIDMPLLNVSGFADSP